MPKEKVLYVCDENHNNRDVPLELEETVPYPENMQYGERTVSTITISAPSASRPILPIKGWEKPWSGAALIRKSGKNASPM